jgi:hypothetical protein
VDVETVDVETTQPLRLHYQDNELRTLDGVILCPDETCPGEVKENDVAVRWNGLRVASDGTVRASTGESSWETDAEVPYQCDTCLCQVEMPPDFEITSWD